ncbi:hypothetical protein LSAT2_000916 [Lamellibrachia satsuma]|nr:hypothetical protein LSAT2_000916 [Lamellibrachia satsuma]
MKDLETLTFKKYCVFALGQENNILICRSHVKTCSTSTKDASQESVLRAFEILLKKIQGIPLKVENSDIQLLIVYNVCRLHVMSLDNDIDSGIQPDVTLDVMSVCHSHMTRLRLCRLKLDSTSEDDATVRSVISVLTGISKTATGKPVPSRDEICLLLCLHSLTLVLEGQSSEAREHLEALSAIHFEPGRLHITAMSTKDRREIQLTEMLSSLLGLVYFSCQQWDRCFSVLTSQSGDTTRSSDMTQSGDITQSGGDTTQSGGDTTQSGGTAHAVYMCAYILYQQQQMCRVVALLKAHSIEAQSQFTSVTHNLLGCCLGSQGKPYSAIEMFKRAALGDSGYPTPLYNMSLQYRRLGLYDAELEALNLLVAQLKNQELSSKKPPTVEFCGDRVRLSSLSPQCPIREEEVTLAQAMYTLCKRCLELERYHDAALGYRTLLTLLHQGHMSSSRTESYVLVSTPLPGVTLATVYVETAYSLLCCGEFSDTVTVCQHLTGRSQDGISMVKCDVEHAAAIMYEVYALVGLNDIDVALSTLDMLIDLIAPTVAAAMAGKESPSPAKRSRSNSHPMEQDMQRLLANAYSYKSVLLLRNNQIQGSLTSSRLALELNADEPEAMYNHTLLLLKLQRTAEACSIWCQYRGITKSCHHPHMPPLHRKVLASEKGSQLLCDLDESAVGNLDDLCIKLSHMGSHDVDMVMAVT